MAGSAYPRNFTMLVQCHSNLLRTLPLTQLLKGGRQLTLGESPGLNPICGPGGLAE